MRKQVKVAIVAGVGFVIVLAVAATVAVPYFQKQDRLRQLEKAAACDAIEDSIMSPLNFAAELGKPDAWLEAVADQELAATHINELAAKTIIGMIKYRKSWESTPIGTHYRYYAPMKDYSDFNKAAWKFGRVVCMGL